MPPPPLIKILKKNDVLKLSSRFPCYHSPKNVTNFSRTFSSSILSSNKITSFSSFRTQYHHRAHFTQTSEPILHQIKTKDIEGGESAAVGSGEFTSSQKKESDDTGWKPIPRTMSISRRLTLYQALAKSRLSSLIVLTTMASYALCPGPGTLASSSLTVLLATATGTYLCSASANTFNQIFEAPFDAQMSRTRGRPLVRRLVSVPHASSFAFSTGITGTLILATMVNPLTAFLGATNLILYAFFYTPLKRISIVNTWLGALVGAIPALMGATAIGAPLNQLSSWLPAGLLYVWQFPHFNSLAHTLRRDYSRAGYQMMSNVSADLNARVSFRYALMTIPLCSYLIPSYGLTNNLFGWLSLIPNLFLIVPALRFWLSTPTSTGLSSNVFLRLSSSLNESLKGLICKVSNYRGSKSKQEFEAKKLFWASLIQLPSILILMMVCKTGRDQEEEEGEERDGEGILEKKIKIIQ